MVVFLLRFWAVSSSSSEHETILLERRLVEIRPPRRLQELNDKLALGRLPNPLPSGEFSLPTGQDPSRRTAFSPPEDNEPVDGFRFLLLTLPDSIDDWDELHDVSDDMGRTFQQIALLPVMFACNNTSSNRRPGSFCKLQS